MRRITILFLAFCYLKLHSTSAQTLNVVENHLPESQKDFVLGTSLIAIGKSTQLRTIANEVANEVTKQFGGQWYAIAAEFRNSIASLYESSASFPVNYVTIL